MDWKRSESDPVVVASLKVGNKVQCPECEKWFPRSRVFRKSQVINWNPEFHKLCPDQFCSNGDKNAFAECRSEASQWDWKDKHGHRIDFIAIVRKNRRAI